MERLMLKEINLVLEALDLLRRKMKGRLRDPKLPEMAASSIGDDLQITEGLIRLFAAEKKAIARRRR